MSKPTKDNPLDAAAFDAVFAMLDRVQPDWWDTMTAAEKTEAIEEVYPLAQARTLDEDAARKAVS